MKLLKLAAAALLTLSSLSAQATTIQKVTIKSIEMNDHPTLNVKYIFDNGGKPLCGDMTNDWAYSDFDDNSWGKLFPAMMSAFAEQRPVQVWLMPRQVDGSITAKYCQVIVMKMLPGV